MADGRRFAWPRPTWYGSCNRYTASAPPQQCQHSALHTSEPLNTYPTKPIPYKGNCLDTSAFAYTVYIQFLAGPNWEKRPIFGRKKENFSPLWTKSRKSEVNLDDPVLSPVWLAKPIRYQHGYCFVPYSFVYIQCGLLQHTASAHGVPQSLAPSAPVHCGCKGGCQDEIQQHQAQSAGKHTPSRLALASGYGVLVPFWVQSKPLPRFRKDEPSTGIGSV